MGNVFSGSEIVEMGVQIERNGKDFYETLAAKAKDSQVRDAFKYLAGEEEKHIGAFNKILSKVERYEPPESYPGEYFAYMRALASEYVFTRANTGKEMAERAKNSRDAVDMGIRFEKDSIIFYEGLKETVPKSQHGPLEALIKEEKSHLCNLFGLKSKVK